VLPDRIERVAEPLGLVTRGAFRPRPDDGVPRPADGAPLQTVVLLGWVGRRQWHAFASSAEAGDRLPDPLDRWSKRVIDSLAAMFGAVALYPFAGPPWLPFQKWAVRAEALHASPLGMLIHPRYGLWHSYRGALGFTHALDIPTPTRTASPCESCPSKPCLTACPVSAFSAAGYRAAACREHVRTTDRESCAAASCASRRACPVGRAHAYGPEQSAFHMKAFASR
jgi:hypothetical protein